MHRGKGIQQVNQSLLKQILSKNKAHEQAVRQSADDGPTRQLEPFLESFESQTCIFTTFSPSFIFEQLQGELLKEGISPWVDDNVYEFTFSISSDFLIATKADSTPSDLTLTRPTFASSSETTVQVSILKVEAAVITEPWEAESASETNAPKTISANKTVSDLQCVEFKKLKGSSVNFKAIYQKIKEEWLLGFDNVDRATLEFGQK